jgi:hypothetical protein
LGIGSLIRG